MHRAFLVDEYRLAGRDVPLEVEAERIECHGLGCNHALDSVQRSAHAQDGRPDSVRIAKRDNAVTDDESDDGVGAGTAAMHALDGVEDTVYGKPVRRLRAELVSEYVEQNLRVRLRIEMPAIALDDVAFQLFGIHEIAVVRQAHAVR